MTFSQTLRDAWRTFLQRQAIGITALLFTTAVLLQIFDEAYHSEYGGHPDEAAHYVTGLMIRDYVAAGFPGSPLAYAKDYYNHYPKVALGNWPPGFYLLQTAWTLPFSPARASVLLLMALLTTVTGLLVFRTLRREFNVGWSALGAWLFVLLPLTQRHTAMVMTEIPMALLTFLAVLCLVRYFESERAGWSVLFGLTASAAIMTKGSGLYLALVPPLVIVVCGKWHLLKKLSFWAAAPIVAVLCGPWMWRFREESKAGWMEGSPSLNFTKQAVEYYPKKLLLALGLGLTLFVLIGLLVRFCGAKRKETSFSRWTAYGAALFALLVFHFIVPCGLEDRHLVPALPFALLFAVVGMQRAAEFFESRKFSPVTSFCLVAGAVLIVFGAQTMRTPAKGYAGFGRVATAILADPANKKAEVLVSSDARGEGMFIAEMAVQEKRPGHTIQRGSKVLASSTWSGGNYKLTYRTVDQNGKAEPHEYQTEEQLRDFLKADKFDLLLVDASLPPHYRRQNHEILERTVAKFPETFVPLETYMIERENVQTNALHLYRIKRG